MFESEKSYAKIALRKIRLQKGLSFIHVAGLAMALAFALLVIAYVRDELTYDRFHERSDRIFQVVTAFGPLTTGASTSPPLGPALSAEFPEIRAYVRLYKMTLAVGRGDKIFNQAVSYADPNFFDVLSFPLEKGALSGALDAPDKVVLTREAARRFFGDEDPLGRKLTININARKRDFLVSGVVREIPENSSITFDLVIPFDNVKHVFDMEFADSLVTTPLFHTTFLELRDDISSSALEKKFPAFVRTHYGEDVGKFKMDPKDFKLSLQKFTDYHLGAIGASGALGARSSASSSMILAALAFLTLLLAGFNTVTLTIGQAAVRSREIGVRKVLGGRRTQIARQFLTESILFSAIALILGFFLATLFLPSFNAFIGRKLSLAFYVQGLNGAVLAALALIIGIVAGMYPALALSGLRTTEILKSKARLGGKNLLGRLLLTLQFGISIFFLTGALVLTSHARLLLTKDPGFDSGQVIMIPTYSFWFGADSGDRTLEVFKNELAGRPRILSVSGASGMWNGGWVSTSALPFVQGDQEHHITLFRVDPDFLKTLNIPLAQGRDFSPDFLSDKTDAVLVNEAFVRRFDLSDPVGLSFSEFVQDPRPAEARFRARIVGVVKDYHFASLRSEVEPLILSLNKNEERIGFVLVKASPEGLPETLNLLKATWTRVQPDKPFEYRFLEDVLADQYGRERNWGKIIGAASGFAIFIAALGLYGFTSLAVAHRTKELGIRKILGASTLRVIALIHREFAGAILAANLIAWPAAYYALSVWLKGYAVRVRLGPGLFLLGSFIALAVAALTVSLRAAKAALNDPVKSLRYD